MSRTYVVTGGASGVGKAAAAYLAGKGGTVITVDRSSGVAVQCDLSTEEGRANMVAQVRERVGDRLNGVIACAGGCFLSPADVKVNYFGTIATVEGLRPLLANAESPRAVIVASINSFWPPNTDIVEACLRGDEDAAVKAGEGTLPTTPYTSAKRALALWLRKVAPTPEWAGAGIGINAIGPGTILTPQMAELMKDPEVVAQMNKMVPMPYNGHSTPEQLAPTLAYLASRECQVMTGQLIFVDGGVDVCIRGADIYSWFDETVSKIVDH